MSAKLSLTLLIRLGGDYSAKPHYPKTLHKCPFHKESEKYPSKFHHILNI